MSDFFEEVKAAVIDDAALSQGDTRGTGRSVSREHRPGSLSLTSWLPLTVSPYPPLLPALSSLSPQPSPSRPPSSLLASSEHPRLSDWPEQTDLWPHPRLPKHFLSDPGLAGRLTAQGSGPIVSRSVLPPTCPAPTACQEHASSQPHWHSPFKCLRTQHRTQTCTRGERPHGAGTPAAEGQAALHVY